MKTNEGEKLAVCCDKQKWVHAIFLLDLRFFSSTLLHAGDLWSGIPLSPDASEEHMWPLGCSSLVLGSQEHPPNLKVSPDTGFVGVATCLYCKLNLSRKLKSQLYTNSSRHFSFLLFFSFVFVIFSNLFFYFCSCTYRYYMKQAYIMLSEPQNPTWRAGYQANYTTRKNVSILTVNARESTEQWCYTHKPFKCGKVLKTYSMGIWILCDCDALWCHVL